MTRRYVWSLIPAIAALTACAEHTRQPLEAPQLSVQRITVEPGAPTLLLGFTSPTGLPAPEPAGDIGILATTTFVRFARSPAEGGGFVDMPVGGTAYFRDVAWEAEAVLEADADGDFWDADVAVPGGGSAAFPRLTFRSEFNGEQDCWVSGFQSLCGSKSIFVSYILGIQCQRGGLYTFHLFENGAKAFEGSFTLKPTLPPGTVPKQYQTSFPDEPYNTLCTDAAGASYACRGEPNEIKRTIKEKGCALTSAAMLLNYFGIPIDAKTLNDYLLSLGEPDGYGPGGAVNWFGVLKRAEQDNQRLTFRKNTSATPQDLRNRICRFGPQIVEVKNRQHFVVVTGLNDAETDFVIADPADPNGRKNGLLNQDYGGFKSVREFGPASQPTFEEVLLAELHSPAELLLTDPLGRQVGFDPARGSSFAEIPSASYDSSQYGVVQDDETIAQPDPLWKELYVPLPTDGEYVVQVTGTASGTYTLNLLGYDRAGRSAGFLGRDIPISSGEVHQYAFQFSATDMSGGTLALSGGFLGGGQRTAVNALLSYARPGQTRTTLPAGATTYSLMVFYHAGVDPSTFQADLNGVSVTTRFTPTPGGSETVNIPLQSGRNVLKLSVSGNVGGRVATDRDQLTFLVP